MGTRLNFDLVTHLIKNRLDCENTFYQILLSARNKNTQNKLKEAIENAIESDNTTREKPLRIQYNCEIVLSKNTPELSIVDYLLWALQRYLIVGDKRFFNALKAKYNLIIDLYDSNGENAKHYSADNIVEMNVTAAFKTQGCTK